jgi:hypothetical protein
MSFLAFISGFPKVHEEYINLPHCAEFLLAPTFVKASPNDVLEHGCEYQKMLLHSAPLLYDKKYIVIDHQVQLIQPGDKTISNPIEGEGDWHVDGYTTYLTGEESRIHIIVSDCHARTEYNTVPLMVEFDELPSWLDFNRYLNGDLANNFVGEQMPPNRFLTFNHTNVHRAVPADRVEIRMWMRFTETNEDPNNDRPVRSGSELTRNGEVIRNIEHRQDGVFLHNTIPFHLRGGK